MLKYAAIVPHSPLLSPNISNKQIIPAKVNDAFASIVEEIRKRGIKHIVSIGAHARFHRHHFSAYIADQYSISFAEFGDLITQRSVKSWKEGFHQLREYAQEAPLEILSSGDLDYTHGIPLLHLTEHLEPAEQICLLAVNDSPDRSLEQRIAFGQHLRKSLDSLNVPYAVFCSGDLYVTTSQSLSKDIHSENKKLKLELEKNLSIHSDNHFHGNPEVKPPTLFSTLPILEGLLKETPFEQKELLFESAIQSSFYIAQLTI